MWKKIEEELPVELHRVLLCMNCDDVVNIGFLGIDGNWVIEFPLDDGFEEELDEDLITEEEIEEKEREWIIEPQVTHWMELPELPQ